MSEDCRHEGGDADARGQGKQVGQDRIGENADRIGRLSGNARQKSKVQHQLDEHDDQLAADVCQKIAGTKAAMPMPAARESRLARIA